MPVDLTIGAPSAPEVERGPADATDVGPADGVLEEAPPVDETVVRGLLKGLGNAASWAAADEDVPDQWEFTDGELNALAPPLTRIINRRPKWRAAVARGDEATVALVLAGYAGRNVQAGKRAEEARSGLEGEAHGATGPAGPGAQSPYQAGGGGTVGPGGRGDGGVPRAAS